MDKLGTSRSEGDGSSVALPSSFSVEFVEQNTDEGKAIDIMVDGSPLEVAPYVDDVYRYQDVFNFCFVALLDWSPTARQQLRLRRKNDPLLNRVEDGPRAKFAEEMVSSLILASAEEHNFFLTGEEVPELLLDTIENMTSALREINASKKQWHAVIKKSCEMYHLLETKKGGVIHCNRENQSVVFEERFGHTS